MPLMSEGKMGPKPAKLRAMWRSYKRKRDELAAEVQRRQARPGYDPAKCLTTETVRSYDRTLRGEETPVGVIPSSWLQMCREMGENAK